MKPAEVSKRKRLSWCNVTLILTLRYFKHRGFIQVLAVRLFSGIYSFYLLCTLLEQLMANFALVTSGIGFIGFLVFIFIF